MLKLFGRKNKNVNNEKNEVKDDKQELLQDIMSDIFDNHLQNETWNGKDIFLNNKYIEHTLEKYHYDYRRLTRRLTMDLTNEQIGQILIDCEIKVEDFYNPTKEVFETLRLYIIYGKKPIKKYAEAPKERSPLDDFHSDIYENHLENMTINMDEDIFLKEPYLENTLRKYHYNYKRLLNRLIYNLSEEEILDALNECNISQEQLSNPSPEVFESLRRYILYGRKINRSRR